MGLELAAIQNQTKAIEALLAAQRETNRLLWAIATQQDPREMGSPSTDSGVPQAYDRKKKRTWILGAPKY